MLRNWRKHHFLRWGAIFFLALFAVTAVAEAAVCQIKTDQNGNCLLPCLCCHVAGVMQASPIIYVDRTLPYVQASATAAPILLAAAIFHPPRAQFCPHRFSLTFGCLLPVKTLSVFTERFATKFKP